MIILNMYLFSLQYLPNLFQSISTLSALKKVLIKIGTSKLPRLKILIEAGTPYYQIKFKLVIKNLYIQILYI